MRFTRRKLAAAAIVPATVLGIGLSASQAASAAPARVTTAAAYQQPQPFRGEALSTMRTYYQDINLRNYASAWLAWSRTGGRDAIGQTYRQFVRGYRTTAYVRIHLYRELRTAGSDSVYLKMWAVQTNGSTIVYNGRYMVNANGFIIMAHVVQTGFIPGHHHPRAPVPPPPSPTPPSPSPTPPSPSPTPIGPPPNALAAWKALANDPASVLGLAYLTVASDLPTSDVVQSEELTQLSQIPVTGATPQQMQEAQADVTALDSFFNTPGFTP
jgi:hypothetical protein